MSYTTIAFAHGDTLAAADIQQLEDNLDAVHDKLGDALIVYPSAHLRVGTDENHWALRRPGDRYLWISGDGTLSVPAIPSINDQAITDEDQPTRFDLDGLGVPVGAILRVSDCTWIMVTKEP